MGAWWRVMIPVPWTGKYKTVTHWKSHNRCMGARCCRCQSWDLNPGVLSASSAHCVHTCPSSQQSKKAFWLIEFSENVGCHKVIVEGTYNLLLWKASFTNECSLLLGKRMTITAAFQKWTLHYSIHLRWLANSTREVYVSIYNSNPTRCCSDFQVSFINISFLSFPLFFGILFLSFQITKIVLLSDW